MSIKSVAIDDFREHPEVPDDMLSAYNKRMETERDRSRSAVVRVVISAVFEGDENK